MTDAAGEVEKPSSSTDTAGEVEGPPPSIDTCPGVIKGRVIRAYGLRNADGFFGMDLFGKSDPYAQVSIPGKTSIQTKVINDSCNPVWNHDFTFQVSSADRNMAFKILDSDVGGSSEPLGEYTLDFRKLEPGKQHVKRVKLVGEKTGEIEFAVAWEMLEDWKRTLVPSEIPP